jgi:hypothetical protein
MYGRTTQLCELSAIWQTLCLCPGHQEEGHDSGTTDYLFNADRSWRFLRITWHDTLDSFLARNADKFLRIVESALELVF